MTHIQFRGGTREVPEEKAAHFEAMVDGMFEAAVSVLGGMEPGDQLITAYGFLVKIFTSTAQARLSSLQPQKPIENLTTIAATASYMTGQALELVPTRMREEAQVKLTMAMMQGSDDHPFEKAMAAFHQRKAAP